jgi:hypothetical protein
LRDWGRGGQFQAFCWTKSAHHMTHKLRVLVRWKRLQCSVHYFWWKSDYNFSDDCRYAISVIFVILCSTA